MNDNYSSLGQIINSVYNNGIPIISPNEKLIQIGPHQFECSLVDDKISYSWVRPEYVDISLFDE